LGLKITKGVFKMRFTITDIKAFKNIPLSRNCSPIDTSEPLWTPQYQTGIDLRGASYPAAFEIKKIKTVRLKVKIKIQCFKPGIYILEGFANGDSNTPIFSSKEMETEDQCPEFKVYDKPGSLRFRRYEGKIGWKLTRKDKKPDRHQNCEMQKTYLELFWLYDYQRKLFRFGVPIEILRHAAYALRISERTGTTPIFSPKRAIEPLSDPVIKTIASACFFRNPPRYDIKGRSYHFLDFKPSFNRIGFRLKKYIKSIHDSTAVCNCYDMAAVVQIHLKAIGIKKVKFCYMEPFGYIRLSNLVGRGLCNNPSYIENPDGTYDRNLIVDENHKDRACFSSHAFCCLPNVDIDADDNSGLNKSELDGYSILDACIGPYNGETFEKYREGSIDMDTPPKGPPQWKLKGKYKGVTHTGYFCPKDTEPKLPYTKALKREVKYSKKIPLEHKHFLVYSLQNPGGILTLISGWYIFFEQIIPGTREVMKTWTLKKLEKEYETIQVDVYVYSYEDVSQAVTAAQNRFLALGSLSTHHTLLYENWTSGPGRYSAKYETKDYSKYLWTKFNTTVLITCQNSHLNANALCLWVKHSVFCDENVKENIEGDLPSPGKLRYKKKIKIGDTVDVELNSNDNSFIDFEELNPEEKGGLHLIYKEDKKLTFTAFKKSTNKMVVVIVNKDTLLTNSETITIEVKDQ
jgi:hypothetical protein